MGFASRLGNVKKAFKWLTLLGLGAAVAAVVYLRLSGGLTADDLALFIKENRADVGWIMALLYLFSPSMALPTFYLTILSGSIWGPFWGVLVDLIGATAGSTLSLLISRHLARDFVSNFPGFKKFSEYVERSPLLGWRLNAYLRINPVFPSAVIGYFFGLTNISVGQFALSTFIFLIPASAATVAVGSSVTSFLTGAGAAGILTAVGVFAVSTALWLLTLKLYHKKASGAGE